MAFTAKNYMPDPDTTVIGGKLIVESGARVVISPGAEVEGVVTEVPKASNVAKAADTAPTKAEFDALIDSLVTAGLMSAE